MAAVFEMWITSSVLIIGILGLRKLTMGKISMRLRYGLWLLVAVRLLLPLSLGTSPVSVMNFFSGVGQEDLRQAGVTKADSLQGNVGQGQAERQTAYGEVNGEETAIFPQNPLQAAAKQSGQNAVAGSKTQSETAEGAGFLAAVKAACEEGDAWRLVVTGVWLFGVLLVGGYLFWMRFRFARYLRSKRQEISTEEIPAVMGERLAARGMRVYRVRGLPSPCLVGRHIYIGTELPGGEQGLLHVLAHEYCHALHGDGFWAFLRCALAALWWFHPLVWAAAFAARQDSDLACDEAAVRLLGEEERFAYGRTLLALLQECVGKTECPGMPLMFSGSERGIRERIVSLTEKKKAEAVVLVAVLSLVLLICGCAFTGAAQEEAVSSAQNRDMVLEEGGEEFERIQKEYGEYVVDGYINTVELTEEQIKELEEAAIEEARQAAFEDTLAYHGVMEGRDDSELLLDRQVDMQHFYEYQNGKREDAPEEGWYRLCRAEDESLSVYGLFTKDFGCRGVKTLIGEDVNTFDLVWYPTVRNDFSENIKVLERAQDGLPRRFVWEYMEEESDRTEISRLASGYRYDTGTVELQVFPEEEYLSWAEAHLTYGIDQEKGQVLVYYDGSGNALAGILDISTYQDFQVEEVQICADTVGFDLNSEIYGEDAEEGYEGMAIHLVPGLRLEGYEELWIYDLAPIAVQLFWDEGEGGFRMGQPKVDDRYQINSLTQERKLEEIRSGKTTAAEDAAGNEQAGENAVADMLAKPLINDAAEAHHDLEVAFVNPCPGYDRISDGYGERVHPVTGEAVMHSGVDLAAAAGTDIVAAADGTVYRVGFDAENGNYVVLWHGQSGQMTYYTHCGETLVKEGDSVAAGQKIAVVGSTGRSTGPHLHFAVSNGENWEEPRWESSQE